MRKDIAVFAALFMLLRLCFPVLSVFADNGGADSFEKQNIAVASAGVLFDNPQAGDTVGDFEKLKEWLNNNSFSYKTVTFSDTITIDDSIFIYGVTLDTAEHGLIIDGSSIVRVNGIKITGEGTAKPVVTIKDGSRLAIAQTASEIAATGTGGIGGCAVAVESGGILEVLGGWLGVSSKGDDAVGIYAESDVELSNTFITADGVGIEAGGDVELFLCDIDAPIIAGGAVLLDTCIASETDESATVVSGKITGIAEQDLEIFIMPVGGNMPWYWFGEKLTVVFDDDVEQKIPVLWDISAIDTSKAGEYEATAEILTPYDGFGLDDDFPLTVTVRVADTSFPVFYDMLSWAGTHTFTFLYNGYNLDGITVLRADSEEHEWYDYTNAATMYDGYEELMLTFKGAPENPVYIQFKVEGLGTSEIMRITWDADGGFQFVLGGDRNFLDRDGEDKLTSNSKPDPASQSESGSKSAKASSSRMRSNALVTAAAEDIDPPPDEVGPIVEAPITAEAPAAIPEQIAAVTAPPNEWENETTTAVSGKRLQMMASSGGKVTFIKQDMRLSFEASAIEALNIEDNQLFMIRIERLGQLKYSVIASIDGKELADLPCVATLDANAHDIVVSGTYDFTEKAEEHEAFSAQAHVSDMADEHIAVSEAENQTQSAEQKPLARPLLVLVGTAGAVGAAAVGLKLRVRKNVR